MRKAFLFSFVSVLLLLVVTFVISSQINAGDNSNIQNADLIEINQAVDHNQTGNHSSDNVSSMNDDNAVSKQKTSQDMSETKDDKDKSIVNGEEDSIIPDNQDVENNIAHAKAISERNNKNLIKSGIIKGDSAVELIKPEKKALKSEKNIPNNQVLGSKKNKLEKKKVKSNDIVDVNSSEQFTELLNGKLPVLVYFFADWSASCDLLDKTMAEISAEASGKYVVAKVDVDSNYGLSKEHDIKTLPTVILFVNGQEKEREVGRLLKYKYENMLASN